jgi:hypothetical protein
MLVRETVTIYWVNHKKETNTLCGQSAEFYYVKEGGTCSNHWAWKDYAKLAEDRVQ